MRRRTHQSAGTWSEAAYSDCEAYRYRLSRVWDKKSQRITFIMLNPSKASETHNDPTVERCERRARAMGFGAFRVVNIFAWRETSPAKLRMASHPIGPENDAEIFSAAQWADLVLAAWGVHGAHLNRGPTVAQFLRRKGYLLYHLGLTSAGHPRHPLYRAYSVKPQIWTTES